MQPLHLLIFTLLMVSTLIEYRWFSRIISKARIINFIIRLTWNMIDWCVNPSFLFRKSGVFFDMVDLYSTGWFGLVGYQSGSSGDAIVLNRWFFLADLRQCDMLRLRPVTTRHDRLQNWRNRQGLDFESRRFRGEATSKFVPKFWNKNKWTWF